MSTLLTTLAIMDVNMTSLNVTFGLNSTLMENQTATPPDPEAIRIFKTALVIQKVYLWIIFAVGFPASIMCILTILNMQAMTPATFYVATLAFCDATALLAKLIGFILSQNQVYLGSFGCKVRFIVPYLSTVGNWVLVLISVERFVSVCLPLKKSYLFTKRRSYISVAVVSLVLLVIFAAFFGVVRDAVTNAGWMCGQPLRYVELWKTYWFWINACIYLLIPFVCIVIFTVLIIHGLMVSRRDRRTIIRSKDGKGNAQLANNRRLLKTTARYERSITLMLIIAAIIFLVLNLPFCVWLLSRKTVFANTVERSKWILFRIIANVLLDSSHAVNFIIYFFSAKRFRRSLKNLPCFRCRRICRNVSASNKKRTTAFVSRPSRYTATNTHDDDL